MNICPKCGTKHLGMFCPECGAEMIEFVEQAADEITAGRQKVCPNCGVQGEYPFFPECGTKMRKIPLEELSDPQESVETVEEIEGIELIQDTHNTDLVEEEKQKEKSTGKVNIEEHSHASEEVSNSEEQFQTEEELQPTGEQSQVIENVSETEEKPQTKEDPLSEEQSQIVKETATTKILQSKKKLVIGGSVAALILLVGLFVFLSTPRITALKASYKGETEAGIVLDENNEGIIVKGFDKNGKEYDITEWSIEEAQTLAMDSSSTVTISYKKLTTDLTVDCSTSELTEISAEYSGDTSKGIVLDSNNKDFTVTAHYKNGTTEVVKDFIINETELHPGLNSVEVSFQDKSTTIDVYSIEVGSLIDIGTYNKKPLEWIVYDSATDSSRCYLLSTRVLYNSAYRFGENDSFLESDLIKNLNSKFSSKVFSKKEMGVLSHWYYDGEDSGNILAIPYSSDINAMFTGDADRKAIDVNGKEARWWLNDKQWVDENGIIQEDTEYYFKENRIAGVRPIINVSKEYVAANLKDDVFSSDNYKPTYVAYNKSKKKYTATVSQLQEDFAKNTFEINSGSGPYIGVDPGNDSGATLDKDYARFSSSNFAGTLKLSIDYVKGESTLIPTSDMDKAIPDIIWVNVRLSSLESNIVEGSLKTVGAIIASLDPDLSTDEAAESLMEDIRNHSSGDHYTSKINGIPYYFSFRDGNIYVEVNTTKK